MIIFLISWFLFRTMNEFGLLKGLPALFIAITFISIPSYSGLDDPSTLHEKLALLSCYAGLYFYFFNPKSSWKNWFGMMLLLAAITWQPFLLYIFGLITTLFVMRKLPGKTTMRGLAIGGYRHLLLFVLMLSVFLFQVYLLPHKLNFYETIAPPLGFLGAIGISLKGILLDPVQTGIEFLMDEPSWASLLIAFSIVGVFALNKLIDRATLSGMFYNRSFLISFMYLGCFLLLMSILPYAIAGDIYSNKIGGNDYTMLSGLSIAMLIYGTLQLIFKVKVEPNKWMWLGILLILTYINMVNLVIP
ncbi:MAG: hypothetical protein IH946_05910 [Bacteroidetes bacterium]|nr:hypothetical protein [Bacteroidota bacterium]